MNENIMRLILPEKIVSDKNYINRGGSDPDKALILPIIILLMAEKCDFIIIFCLLYILM